MSLLMPRRATVVDIKKETRDVSTYLFQMIDDEPFSFKAGQFNMIGLHGIGEAPISFSSNLLDANSFAHTIRFVGNVTELIRRLKPGDTVQVRGPYGSGWPIELMDGRDVIVVAGGIGMAPLRPVVHELVERKKTEGRFYILYGARTPDDLLYKDEIRKWKGKCGVRVLIAVDEAEGDMDLVDEVGVVTALVKNVDINFKEAICLVCGPEIMMRFVARDLILRGVAPSSIHVSLERRMYCGIGHCGHCQIGAEFVCKDGPVFKYNDIKRFSDTLL